MFFLRRVSLTGLPRHGKLCARRERREGRGQLLRRFRRHRGQLARVASSELSKIIFIDRDRLKSWYVVW